MLEIPGKFISGIEDEDLRETVRAVFAKLPPLVQVDLSIAVEDIRASQIANSQLLHTKGGKLKEAGKTEVFDPQSPGTQKYIVRLHTGLDSFAVRAYVVAHEFAHVHLRHVTFWRAVKISVTSKQNLRKTFLAIEDHADFQVCLWGFKQDLLAYHEMFPRRKPAFIQLLTDEALSAWIFPEPSSENTP